MTATDAWLLLTAAALVVIAGLLVGAETAIGRVSRARVDEMAREGVRGAGRLAALLADRARYVNVLLFLSTVATVTAVALVTVVSVDWLSTGSNWPLGWAVALAVGVMVIVSYVALGVAPRTLGRQRADRIALRAAGPARLLAALLAPLAGLLILVGNALTPGRGYREGPFTSQAELRELVDQAGDVVDEDEREMIHSVFELGDTLAREVMVPRTETVFIERDRSLSDGLALALRSGYSRIPVVGASADDVVGIVYLKDIVRRLVEHREAEQAETVGAHMRAAYFVPDTKRVDDLLREMQAARVHLAVVVDEYGGTAGMVSIEDILEEIVGEITDEHDTMTPELERLPDGAFRLSSRMHVDDAAALLGLAIDADAEGVDTLLGLMAKRIGRVPVPGTVVRLEGWSLAAEPGPDRRNRIGTVLATPVVPQPSAPATGDESSAPAPDDESSAPAPREEPALAGVDQRPGRPRDHERPVHKRDDDRPVPAREDDRPAP